jgi:hypothetical protein
VKHINRCLNAPSMGPQDLMAYSSEIYQRFRDELSVRIPDHREHSFRFNVNADSADAEQRFRPS